jgi:hypothetical protein
MVIELRLDCLLLPFVKKSILRLICRILNTSQVGMQKETKTKGANEHYQRIIKKRLLLSANSKGPTFERRSTNNNIFHKLYTCLRPALFWDSTL